MSLAPPDALPGRIAGALRARFLAVRALPVFSPAAVRGTFASGRHPAETSHVPHAEGAIDWLCAAQDACGGGGIARGYSLTYSPYFRSRGWQPAYPETTGYIIPTLLSAARFFGRPELAERALLAARWEVRVQLADGAVRGGVMGEPESPAIFNTGQVMLGWLASWEERGDDAFAAALARAGRFLAACEQDGRFVKGNSRFARGDATAYNARAAWALAEAGVALNDGEMVDAAARVLRDVAASQHANGWFPRCCLNDPERPLLHTLAYTVRGLLEGGRVLEDAALVASARLAAERLAAAVGPDGWMPGRFSSDWRGAASWSCLTGQAQMANNWLRLREMEGGDRWLEPARRSLAFLKTTQDRETPERGVRGGLAGSDPPGGEYGRWEMLSWAAKFFADALMRDHAARGRPGGAPVSRLA
ncbi:MAG TPA: hypothetical protein VFE05_18510 [Longimicrobiaceae bacterium]|jgi:uncharacterized protein YyaL (SSP411 family)|nr:hypothetical protein [Longimicrobiaceae bacterium]